MVSPSSVRQPETETSAQAEASGNEFHLASVGTLAACIIISMFSAAPVIGATLGIFMKSMSHDFGWGRAEVSGINFVIPLTITFLTPLCGTLIDRWGVRRVVLPAMALYALSVMTLSMAAGTMVAIYGLFGLVAVLGTPVGPLATSKAITGWFFTRRGLALGLGSGLGGGLGLSLMPQAALFLFERFGWRVSYLVLGAVILLIALPVVAIFLREAPAARPVRRETPAEDDGPPVVRPGGVSGGQALRDRHFWLLVGAIALITLGIGGTLGHLVPMLTDRGVDGQTATNVLSLMALSLFLGQVIAGLAMDRANASIIAVPFFVACLAGVVVLQYASGATVLLLGGVALGFGLGAETSMVPYFVTRYFGLREFGRILGYVLPFSSFSAAGAPLFMGLVFDTTGSYERALWTLEGGMIVAILMLVALGRFRYDARPDSEVPSAD